MRLGLAAEQGALSVAFPAISTGIYRFPFDRASRIALRETAAFLQAHERPNRVVFVCFGAESASSFRRTLAEEAGRPA